MPFDMSKVMAYLPPKPKSPPALPLKQQPQPPTKLPGQPTGQGQVKGGFDMSKVLPYLPKDIQKPVAPPQMSKVYLPAAPKPVVQPQPGGVQTPPMETVPVEVSKELQYEKGPAQPLPERVTPGWTFLGQKAGQVQKSLGGALENVEQIRKDVAEAGQGKYKAVKGLGDIMYNVGQWNPFGFEGAGKTLTALGGGAKVLGNAALLGAEVLGTGAEGVERLIGDQVVNRTNLRQKMGADPNDPAQELALQTALGVTYSGPEAIKSAYKDALELSQAGQLTPENARLVGAKHGVWYKEALGQIILDPLNLLDAISMSGKAIRYADDIAEVSRALADPLLVKGTKEIVPVEQISKYIADLSTRTGQAAGEVTPIKKAIAYAFPRLRGTEAHLLAERTTQIVDIAAGITVKRATSEIAKQGLSPGTEEFGLSVAAKSAERFQEIANLWAETANVDSKIATMAADQLAKLGFGDIPRSMGGRVTGVVLRDMMEKPGSGELGALSGALDIARAKGLSAEHAAEMWYEQAVKVLEKRLPKPKFETGAAFEVAQGIKKLRKPVDNALGAVFFGLNPGYAARNYYMNLASASLHGYLPFQVGKKLDSAVGFAVKGAEEGIGQAGLGGGGLRRLPGYKLAQWGEKAVSRPVAEQGRLDTLKLLWPKALEQLGVTDPVLARKLRDVIYQGADAIDKLAAEGATTTVEEWRHIPDELMQVAQGVDAKLYPWIADTLAKAKSPEEAATAIQQFIRASGEHATKLAEASKPIDHAAGTMTGQAIKSFSDTLSEKQLTKLSGQLGQIEHTLQQARNKAYNATLTATDPSAWLAMLDKVEGRYNQAMEEIIRRQLVGFAKLQAGEITPELYSKALIQIYKDAQTKLFESYAKVTGAELQLTPRLRQMVLEMAHNAGVESATTAGKPNPHFMNKVRKILRDTGTLDEAQAKKLQNITDLSDEQMVQVISWFGREQGLPNTSLEQLYQQFFGGTYSEEIPALKGLAAIPEDEAADVARLAASKNPQVTMAAVAAQEAIDLAPSPSLADGTFAATKEATKVLDGVIQHIMGASQVAPTQVNTALPDFWNQVLNLYTQTHLMAAEVGRKARNRVLLDYGDRRTFDVFAQTVFPWHYWSSRNTPNWAKAIIARPVPALHYMKLKRELREYNDNDPNIPEWAKEQIVLHPPGYDGAAFLDYDAAFNGVQTIFDSFDNPDQQRDAFGQVVAGLGAVGAAPHPLLMMAYAAERGLLFGDETAARSYGYLGPQTKGFANLTGKTLEPWLWLKDPKTGKPIPFSGGTSWDIEKGIRKLGYKQGQGQVAPEAAMLGAATHAGPEFEQTLTNDIAQARRVPVFLSMLLGLRVSVRQGWENKVTDVNNQYTALRQAGKDDEAMKLLGANPWLSTVWMSWDNEATRMKMLANNVLNRIPPMKGDERQKILDRAGLSPDLMEMYYETTRKNPDALSDWDRGDYNQFTNAILDLAELLKIPDARTAREWRDAREGAAEMYASLDKQYPQAQAQQRTYFDIKTNQGEEAARAYLQTTNLSDYWQNLNKMLLERPMVLKYYQEPGKVDSIAESLAYEELERRYPGIFELRQQAAQIPDNDYQAKREFRRLHPEVSASYDEQKALVRQFREELEPARELTQTGQQVPGTIDYIVKGQPNATQRGLLKVIAELGFEARKPVPEPQEEPAKFTPQEQAIFRARDAVYAQAVQQFPQLPDWEREYQQIKEVYGKDSANLWAKQTGLFKARDAMTMAELGDPGIVAAMDDQDLDWSAKVLVRQQANQMFPGIEQTLDQYFALPEKSRERKAMYKAHPEIGAYYDYKERAEPFYKAQLYQHRAQLIGGK